MRATLASTYEELDSFVPDDVQVGDSFVFTATAEITEITHTIGDVETTRCVVTLDGMRLA